MKLRQQLHLLYRKGIIDSQASQNYPLTLNITLPQANHSTMAYFSPEFILKPWLIFLLPLHHYTTKV